MSFFTITTTFHSASIAKISVLVCCGIAYITIGIYGYAICARSPRTLLRLAYFFIQLVLGGVIVYLSAGVSFNALILLPLAGHSVLLLTENWTLAVNSAMSIIYAGSMYYVNQGFAGDWSSLLTFFAGQVFIIFFTQMAVNEERARIEVEKLAEDLKLANERLRDYANQIEENTIVKERNRMAREIHDGLGHSLTTIHMQIQAANAVMDSNPTAAKKTLESARELTRQALSEVRSSVSTLRSSPEEELSLLERIHTLLDRSQSLGLDVDWKVVGSPRPLSSQGELTIYRTIQEAINNTFKHAEAQHVWVLLDYSLTNQVKLSVSDDGHGTDDLEGGFGLIGIKERVQILGGDVRIDTSPGNGFEIQVTIPE